MVIRRVSARSRRTGERKIRRAVVFALALLLAGISLPRLEAKSGTFSLKLAGTLPDVERAILEAVHAINATGCVHWIAADTNGRVTVASLGFVYLAGERDSMQVLQARAWTLLRTVFAAVPTLDEVHLSGIPSLMSGLIQASPTSHFLPLSHAVSSPPSRKRCQGKMGWPDFRGFGIILNSSH